jgi:16S rRNA (adenine1518-N6/adenine1519-N6)-dimethyltransferase
MSEFSLPPLNIARILKQYGLHPKKGLGQNFLQENRALQKVVAAAELGPGDHVLEIGAGLGSLTRYLALEADSVTAVELDRSLFPALEDVLGPYANVRLIQGDILELEPSGLVDQPGYLVVANIPYYITSAILRHLVAAELRPQRMILTMQEQVAERICADPGAMSILALSVQVFGKPSIRAHIPAEAFYPSPQVDSAVLRVDLYPEPSVGAALLDEFFQLVKAGFSQKRKKLRNALAGGLRMPPAEAEGLLESAGIDPKRRAETLELEEWGKLALNYRGRNVP